MQQAEQLSWLLAGLQGVLQFLQGLSRLTARRLDLSPGQGHRFYGDLQQDAQRCVKDVIRIRFFAKRLAILPTFVDQSRGCLLLVNRSPNTHQTCKHAR